jgi:hypothetical protein
MGDYVNRFQVYAYGDVVRIVFEDCVTGTEGVIQANVVMRTADAEQLGAVLADQIRKAKKPS